MENFEVAPMQELNNVSLEGLLQETRFTQTFSGSQFAQLGYTVLESVIDEVIQAIPSMSGLGNCYDNAKAEAFFKTLKTECFPVSNCARNSVMPGERLRGCLKSLILERGG